MTTARNAFRRLRPEVPVFDKARAVDCNPIAQAGLNGHAHNDLDTPLYFTRNDHDRRPGKPLPPEATGDPHPDRLARAEALRLAILAKESKHKIEGSVDREETHLRPAPRPGANGKGHRSSTPDIEKPRSYYIDCPREDAALEARRGDQVLYFFTATDAARCMTGERKPQWVKAVQNAAGGITKSAFGWTWYRLKSVRGRRRVRL